MLTTCHEPLSRFGLLSDEEVVGLARTGSSSATQYLLVKFRGMVESKARAYYLAGADHEDVVQEGMIGLYKAIRDFRDDRLAHFRAFADLCITRQIITAVKSATRQKHVPLNGYVSLSHNSGDGDAEICLLDCIPDEHGVDPAEWLIERRDARWLNETARHLLSELEASVLEFYLEGRSYQEMSEVLRRRTKCIDNALQRVKRKVGALIPAEPVVSAVPEGAPQ